MTASNGGAPCLRAGDVAVPIVVIELEGIAGPSAFWSRDRSRRLSQNLIANSGVRRRFGVPDCWGGSGRLSRCRRRRAGYFHLGELHRPLATVVVDGVGLVRTHLAVG